MVWALQNTQSRRHDLKRHETILVEVKLKSFTALVCCWYRSDFIVTLLFYISELQDIIEAALDVILVGDIHIDFVPLTNLHFRDCL